MSTASDLAKPVVMGSMTAGSVRCYAAMLAAKRVYVDAAERNLPLRHSHHRYLIDGPNGVHRLTVALARRTNAMPVAMRDVLISEHGDWRRRHWGALFSAYGKTPYFDYIADDLQPIVMGCQSRLLDFNRQLQRLIVDFLDLPIEVITVEVTDALAAECVDLRGRMGGKQADALPIADVPYPQLWAARHGFQPGLSILDLLMNEGREAIFTLQKMLMRGG